MATSGEWYKLALAYALLTIAAEAVVSSIAAKHYKDGRFITGIQYDSLRERPSDAISSSTYTIK